MVGRLFGLVALDRNKQIDEALKLLETQLERDKKRMLDIHNINILTALYRRKNQVDKEISFLKKVLDNPMLEHTSPLYGKVKNQYDNLIKENLTSKTFS